MISSLLAYLVDNWPELLWIVAAAGIPSYLAGRRSRSRWRNRDFLDRLHVSLTSLEAGRLQIRTVLEAHCDAVFLNPTASREIVALARLTTEADPILPIPAEDRWQYLNAVLNEVCERFVVGQFRRDLGVPVHRADYLLCLTCERAGPVRTQKVRGILVRRELLMDLPPSEPVYDSAFHQTRWHTLRCMAERYASDPSLFIEMEICL